MKVKFYSFFLLTALLVMTAGCAGDPGNNENKKRVDIELTRAEQGMVSSNNRFAFDIYSRISAEANSAENTVFSPLSLTLLMAMINNGAVGETQQQIMEPLGFGDYTADELNAFYRKMLDAAANLDPKVTVETANSIWVKNGFPVKPAFVKLNEESYDAEVKNVDLLNPATLTAINNWASQKTHGKIEKILDEIDPHTVMILMNALYFKGSWTDEFDKKSTKEEYFTKADGSKVKVKMMKQTQAAGYTENELYSSACLTFGNEAFYMSFILPNEGITISKVLSGIREECIAGTDLTDMEKVSFSVPKFSAAFEMQLDKHLKKMGMELPFKGSADFSAMHSSPEPVWISFIKQKAFIEVDEKGAEAAAVTVGGMVTEAGPRSVSFILDRPFLFMIREASSGAIYFMGEYNG